jgi:hypothetical protein
MTVRQLAASSSPRRAGWRSGAPIRRHAALIAGVLAVQLGGAARLRAGDANADFLAALRERGWDDTAVAYLDWVESSPLMTDEFRPQLPYERALSLAAQARGARIRDERQRLLAEAAGSFEQFAEGDAASPVTLDALRQSANLYAELALTALAQARQNAGQGANAARDQALEHFDRAMQAASRLLEFCTDRLAQLPKPTVALADPAIKAERDQLRNRQAEAQFLMALISFERAGAYDHGSAERSEALDDAWSKFGRLVEQYRDTLVGASSRFYQGRCAQEQGDYAKALGCFEDLVKLPAAEPDFRRWTARAHRRRAECLIALEKYADAVRGCEDWLAASKAEERTQPEWLEVAYQLAAAYQAQLKDMPPGQAPARRLQSKVRELLRLVAGGPNDFQQDARLGLASLARTAPGETAFKSFADALAGGKSALELMNSSLVAAQVAKENNPEAVADLERDAAASKDEALRAFAAALDLADAKTPLADLNGARYYLAWLYWEAGRVEEAAVLGEFLASRYGDGEFGPGAAKIALAAWEKLYQQSRGAEATGGAAAGAFAAAKLADVAQLIATRWPEAPEAASAVNILINIALREQRIDEAQKLLEKLPEHARAGAQLSLGSALWTQYLQTTEGSDSQFDPQAAALREQARALLAAGFATARQRAAPTTNTAVGALYLVQLLLTRGDGQAAIDVLEDKNAGPLALVEAKSVVAERPEFVLETYKAALRAYLTAQPPNRDRAQAMMEALEKFAAGLDGDSPAQQVTKLYVGVGLQLQRQIKELTDAGNALQAQQVAAAFGDVLDRVARRPDAGDWAIRNWIANTNLQLGQGLAGPEAAKYLTRARDAYQAVLAAAAQGGGPDATVVLGVRKRLGDCLVALGEYQAGLEQYTALLQAKPNTLDVQVAAARALQEWGVKIRSLATLDQAVHGALPQRDGKNLVWGWVRLGQAAEGARARAAAAGNAQDAEMFANMFYEAHFNVAKTRYLGGLVSTGVPRNNQLTAAAKLIAQMQALYPDMHGGKWKPAFDNLLAQVNAELKKG